MTCFSKDSGAKNGAMPHTEKVRIVAEAAGVEHETFVFNRLAVCSTENSCLGRMGWEGGGRRLANLKGNSGVEEPRHC